MIRRTSIVTRPMRTPVYTAAALAALGFVLAAPAKAQDRTASVDSIFSFASAETPGCAVGASQQGKVVVNRAYGLGDMDRRVPLGATSLFDIGSTQKQFAAAAVLLLVQDGRLALTDDVRKHIPELPDYGHPITLEHLLTHTSGLRDWTGLLPFAEGDQDVLTLILRQRGLNFTPGTEWSYSNSGYVLVKEVVARASGMSFAEFLRRRIFEPLGMRNTSYVADIMQAAGNRALGYQKEGAAWKPFMRLGNNRGGGTIAATIGDLLVWNEALGSGKLGAFVTGKLQEPARLANGRQLTYARGLNVDSTPGGVVISHSGGAAGFSTWMGRVPEHGLSVVVSCNFDPVSATALANRVAGTFLPPVDAQARARAQANAPVAAPGVDVSSRAGLYFDEHTGDPMRLGVANGRLQVANGPPLVPVSQDRFRSPRPDLFFRSQDAFEMRFLSNDQIEIRSMEGQVARYRRAESWTPAAADLQAVEGRYRSEELGSVFEILPGPAGLVMRFERSPEQSLVLAPVSRDTWMLRMMIVRFNRDAAGRITGFDYGNPLVRSIRFTRLGERTSAGAASAPAVPPANDPAVAAAHVPAPPAAAPPAAAAPAVAPPLEGLAGEYEIAPGRTLRITVEGGQLHGQPPGGEKRPLTHVSGTTFAATGSGVTLIFAVGADGRATAALMQQGGRERNLPKVR